MISSSESSPSPTPQVHSRALIFLQQLLRDALKISISLFKVMVPVSIAVRILQQLGVVNVLADILAPAMHIVGLPGSMGLVWATTLFTNLYGGMAVFVSLAPDNPMSVAQVTVLGTVMLIAHALPVESAITQQSGPRLRVMAPFRFVSALLCGWVLYRIYAMGQWLEGKATILWTAGAREDTWAAWAWSTVRNLGMIFLIILGLLVLIRILDGIGLTRLIIRVLQPVLTRLGIGPGAAPITIIGMMLGLTYGGGLIIGEAKSGRIGHRDIFFSLALMSLCHSVIEDTLLMMALGASSTGVLWGRLVFSLLAVYMLVQVVSHLPERVFDRHFFRVPDKTERPADS
jgi:hypothetical protein